MHQEHCCRKLHIQVLNPLHQAVLINRFFRQQQFVWNKQYWIGIFRNNLICPIIAIHL